MDHPPPTTSTLPNQPKPNNPTPPEPHSAEYAPYPTLDPNDVAPPPDPLLSDSATTMPPESNPYVSASPAPTSSTKTLPMEMEKASLIMRELAKARHSLDPYPPGDWNDSNVWTTFMEAVLGDDNTREKRNEVMTIVYNLEKIFLDGGVERLSDSKLRLYVNTVFGPKNADVGGLRTYALDPSILPAQLLYSDVPELGIPKNDDDDEEEEEKEDQEECAEFVQNVRKKSKFPKAGSLEIADVVTRRRHPKPHFEAGNSSRDFRKPYTTIINSQQMALVYSEATKHLDPEALGRLLCHMPPDSLQFQNIAMKPLSDRPRLVSSVAENVGSYIQRPSSIS